MTAVEVQRVKDAPAGVPIFQELSRQMEEVQRRAFELFAGRGFGPGNELNDWIAAEQEVLGWPATELTEKDTEYELDMSLAGFTPKEIEITATPGEVVVKAASEQKREKKEAKVLWSEFGRKEVYRRVAFPGDVDLDHVTAELANGMLKVHAPKAKAPATSPREIEVKPR